MERGRRPHTSGAPRWIGPLLALAALALGACGGPFPQSALDPASDFAWKLQDLFEGIFFWAVIVFVLVEGALIVAIFRFRERPGGAAPRATHGNTLLEISWTLAPAVVLVLIAIPTIRTIWDVDQPARGESLVVEAIGHQWWWEFRYPDLGVVTANEMHIPVGTQIDVRLTSADVIHSFWFPRLGGKRDAIPGHENQIWFTADSAGLYLGQCAEFCGLSHALMKMQLVAEAPEAFQAWVDRQKSDALAADSVIAAEGSQAFMRGGCIACHKVRGTVAQGVIGPDLTHVGSRRRIAAGILDNTPENLERWIRNPQAVKPGALMVVPELDDETVRRIVAYLQSLK
ncbi:MAG: cytochrome c oxidase subunit II [Candidatus Palauibacterales bacterium]|nr:cytochrome c oxidase subunit II [Candidatus Palauibacterales bacterium]